MISYTQLTLDLCESDLPGSTIGGYLSIVNIGSFPGGPVVKNQPAKAGHIGSFPGPGGSHMPWGTK